MAKDVYYFSHDVNASNDPKIVAMESEFGVISYAWWWKLIEKLASSEDYRLPFKKYTFIALDKELGILNKNERPLNENERPLNENEQGFFCSNKSFSFINSLIYDFELLECNDEYFWSPSLIRRQEERRSKFEKKQEQRRLAGIKSGEARRKKEQNRKERKVYIHIHIIATLKMKNQIRISYPCLMNLKNMIHIKTCSKFI